MCWNQPPDLTWAQALKAYIVKVFLFAVLCIAFFASPMAQPKKPTGGAYGQFLAEKRAEFQKHCEGQRVTAVTKLAGEKFRALSEEEKAVHQKKFQEAQAKYEIDMKAFLDAGGEKKTTQRKGKASKEKKGNKVKDPEAPKKPAGGAYGCFLAKNRAAFQKECVGQPVTAVTKLASTKWKELNAEEKKIYEDEYQAKKEAYQEAMKSYVPKAVPEAEQGEVEEAPVKKARTEKAAVKKVPKATDEATANKASKAKANTLKAEVELQATVAAKAEKLGLKDGLLKLAARPDVKASGKSQGDMLKALEEHGGLLHPAKRALLGAWRPTFKQPYAMSHRYGLRGHSKWSAHSEWGLIQSTNSSFQWIWFSGKIPRAWGMAIALWACVTCAQACSLGCNCVIAHSIK